MALILFDIQEYRKPMNSHVFISLSFSPSENLTLNFQNYSHEIRLEGLATRWKRENAASLPGQAMHVLPCYSHSASRRPVPCQKLHSGGWLGQGHSNSTDNILWDTFLNHDFLKLGAVSICGSAATASIIKNQTTRHKAVDQVSTLRVQTTFLHSNHLQEMW